MYKKLKSAEEGGNLKTWRMNYTSNESLALKKIIKSCNMIKFEKVNNLKIPCIITALEKIIKLIVDTVATSIILERIENKEREC